MLAGLSLLLFSSLPSPLPQDPAATQVIARCTVNGEELAITRGDVALEMAFHLRRKDEGRGACEHLTGSLLVQLEAKANDITATDDEMRAEWNELQRQYRAAGRDPKGEPVVRNSTEQELLQYFSMPVLLRKLVRKALAMQPKETVGPEMMQLWLQDAKKARPIVDDPDQLPLGIAARVGDRDIPLMDLGLLLLRTSSDDQRDYFIRQVVVLQGLDRLARVHGVTVGKADLEREVELRRQQAAADPRFQGLTFEQLLKTQGVTIAWLLESRVFRAQVLQKRIAAAQHPVASLQQELTKDHQSVLDRVGPRRRIGLIFARALDEPNELVPRTFDAALKHLQGVKDRLAKEAFDRVAAIESDDPGSKARGGDLGWYQRKDGKLPEAVLAAAFALPKDAVSEPIRGVDGCYLVKALAIEPDLDDAALLDRLRDSYAADVQVQLLLNANIRLADGSPLGGSAGGDAKPTNGAGRAPAAGAGK